MTRRAWWAWLLGGATAEQQFPKRRKFYITGGHTAYNSDGSIAKIRDDCVVPPLVSYGTSRLDAIANSGITVWEEAEYERSEKLFRGFCKQRPEGKP